MSLSASRTAAAAASLALLLPATGTSRDPMPAEREWRTHGGDPGHTQFSPLDQIDTSNVGGLEVAWTYRTGDAREEGRSQIQCNPIVVDGVLYGTTARVDTFALDAATGRELWRFRPSENVTEGLPDFLGANRGVTYWSDGKEARILVTVGQHLSLIHI